MMKKKFFYIIIFGCTNREHIRRILYNSDKLFTAKSNVYNDVEKIAAVS